jgi:hypothetical protein
MTQCLWCDSLQCSTTSSHLGEEIGGCVYHVYDHRMLFEAMYRLRPEPRPTKSWFSALSTPSESPNAFLPLWGVI